MGAGFGFGGFAEGFAKAFTEARREQRQTAAKKDEFITEQLIKGALTDPKAVADSPELLADIEKRLGPQGGVFTEFLKQHAKNIQDDDIIGQLLKPEGAAAPATAQPAAPPEAALIGGMSPVTQPGMVEPPAPQAPPLTPTVQPGRMNRKQTAAASQVGATLASMREQLIGEIEAGRMTEEQAIKQLNAAAAAGLPEGDLSTVPAGAAPAATPAAPGAPTTVAPSATAPKTRAEAIQRKLLLGQTLKVKGKDKAELTLQGGSASEIEGYQTWQGFLAQGHDVHTSAQATQQALIAKGITPPKFINDLVMAPITRANAVRQAREIEEAKREVAKSAPKTAEDWRTAATSGLAPGASVIGRDLKDADLIKAVKEGNLIHTAVDGTKIAVPRDYAQANGLKVVNPQELLDESAARKMAAKKTAQNENANIMIGILDRLKNTGGYQLLLPAPKTIAGMGAMWVQARTTNRLNLALLRKQGNDAAIAMRSLKSAGTPYVKALGDSGQIAANDREAFEEIVGGVANGTASMEEGLAVDRWLRDVIGRVSKGEKATDLNIDAYKKQVAAEAAAAEAAARSAAGGAGPTTTTTTLPLGARIITKPDGSQALEFPD